MRILTTLRCRRLTAARMISVFCAVRGTLITPPPTPPASEPAADLRHLLSAKAGGLKKKRSEIVQPLCVIASKPTWGAALCVYCFCPVWVPPPPPSSPTVCPQPTAATLIIWRLRWASLTLWWRPSVGCCFSLWTRRPMLHRGHGTLRKVSDAKLTPDHRPHPHLFTQHNDLAWNWGFTVFLRFKNKGWCFLLLLFSSSRNSMNKTKPTTTLINLFLTFLPCLPAFTLSQALGFILKM